MAETNQLTPMDIHNKEFTRRGRNGYDRYEVDSFLDKIVDDYGDTLDEVVDLKNKSVILNKKIDELQAKVNNFDGSQDDADEILISAQKSANRIKADAKEEAKKILADAKQQADYDTDYQKQQQGVLNDDYKRLKQEVGEFRKHIQTMLQKQIDSLNDDEWQHALDKYFKTDRFYPEDGSEPIPMADSQEEEFAREEKMDKGQLLVDSDDEDEVDSYQEPEEIDLGNSGKTPQPMTGDSPKRESMRDDESDNEENSSATIVFPDDYKDHK